MSKQFIMRHWGNIFIKTKVISADSSTTLFYEEKLADSDDNLGSTTSNTVIQLLLFFFYFYITAKKNYTKTTNKSVREVGESNAQRLKELLHLFFWSSIVLGVGSDLIGFFILKWTKNLNNPYIDGSIIENDNCWKMIIYNKTL